MEKLPTIDIHGKEYVLVKDRITRFNELFKDGSIQTEILKNDEVSVVVKAKITIPVEKGLPHSSTTTPSMERDIPERIFTGHSEAYRDKSNMGKVPVEVAETSAVGRALAMLGIGIVESVASADEVVKSSQTRQDAPQRTEPAKMNVDPRVPQINEDEPYGDPMALICSCGQPKKRMQVKKEGPNKGRYFWSCPKPMRDACPNSFQWDDDGDSRQDNVEGEKSIDYSPSTGELLP